MPMLMNALVQLYAFALAFQLVPFLVSILHLEILEGRNFYFYLLLLFKSDAMTWNLHGL